MSGILSGKWSCPICGREYASEECPAAREEWHTNMVRQHEEIDFAKMNSPVYNKNRNNAIRKEIWLEISEVNPYAKKTGRGNHIGRIRILMDNGEEYRGDEVRDEGGKHLSIWWCANGRIDNFKVLKYEDILIFSTGEDILAIFSPGEEA